MFFEINNFNFPVGSEEYDELVKLRRSTLNKKDEYTLCFKNEFHEDIKSMDIRKMDENFFFIPFLDKAHNLTVFPIFSERSLLDNTMSKTLASINNLYWKKRSESDITPTYSQLVCGLCIEDTKGNVLVLKNKSFSDMKNTYGFVQGHISFNKNVYLQSFGDYLLSECKRELFEEVKADHDFLNKCRVIGFRVTNTSTSIIDVMHTGLFIKAIVDDLTIMGEFKSNEPDKHDVMVMTKECLLSKGDELDSWVREILR